MALTTKVLNKLTQVIHEKGGFLLSGAPVKGNSILTLKCKNNHTFNKAVSKLVYDGDWCVACNEVVRCELWLQELQTLAESKKGKFLSTTYTKSYNKYLWQCAENHQWWATANSARSGYWCPHCKKGLRTAVSHKLIQIIKDKEGILLSGAIIDQRSVLSIKCKNNHIFKQSISKIIYDESWCTVCNRELQCGLELQKLQELAKSKQGKLLSTTYTMARDKYLWQCAENHQWWAAAQGVSYGQWCPHCSGSLGERLCRTIFEQIFNKPFIKVKPEWLQFGKSYLELDGYCEELNLAFEYNGLQHYTLRALQVVSRGHATQEDLDRNIKRDEEKRLRCEQRGIRLIEIPQISLCNLDNFKQVIISALKEKNIDIHDSVIDYSLAFLSASKEKLNNVKKIAQARGGDCLSENYISSETPLLFVCAKNHKWTALSYDIGRGVWCRECVHPRVTLDRIKKIVSQYGGVCLSSICENGDSPLKLQCSNGHTWETRATNIVKGYWCSVCHRNGKILKSKKETLKILNKKLYYVAGNVYLLNTKTSNLS